MKIKELVALMLEERDYYDDELKEQMIENDETKANILELQIEIQHLCSKLEENELEVDYLEMKIKELNTALKIINNY